MSDRDAKASTRWRDGAAPIAGLAESVSALGAQHATDAELGRLRAALAPLLEQPTASTGSAAVQATAGLSFGRVWPWLSAIVMGIATTWGIAAREPSQAAAPSAAETPVLSAEPSHAEPAIAPAPAPPSLEPTAPAATAGKPKATKRVAAPPLETPTAPGAPEAELALLQRAQEALNRSASSALAIANEHERLYPSGIFVQEREMLRIEAELTLGQRRRALSRASAFAQRFGRSTYRARIDKLLAAHDALKTRESEAPEGTQ